MNVSGNRGQDVGYIRVSSEGQNADRQLDGVALDRIYEEKVSAKDALRPKLQECIEYVRAGDVLHVHSMDRLARNLDDLRSIVRTLTGKGVAVKFHKEGLTFTGDDSPMATLLLSVMGAFAEFERGLIRERQAEGIALAKQKGVYRGRKPTLSADKVAELQERAAKGEKKARLAREFGVSRETVYSYLARRDS